MLINLRSSSITKAIVLTHFQALCRSLFARSAVICGLLAISARPATVLEQACKCMPLQRIEERFVDIHGSSALDLADKRRWTAVFNQFKLINGLRENALIVYHFYGERPRDYAVSTARSMLSVQFFCEAEAALVQTALFRGR